MNIDKYMKEEIEAVENLDEATAKGFLEGLRYNKARVETEIWIILAVFQILLLLSILMFTSIPDCKERTILLTSKFVSDVVFLVAYIDLRIRKKKILYVINEVKKRIEVKFDKA